MMKTKNKIVTILVVTITVLLTFKGVSWYYEKKNEEYRIALRKERIKNSKLEKINEGLYTKLVADTLTYKQLRKINDSLQLQLQNPNTIVKTVIVPKEIEKPVDEVVVNDSIITTKDFYPNKDDPFVTYTSNINLNTKKGKGKFSFNPIEMNLGIGQNEDGTYSINTKLPEFFNVTSLDVQSLPLEPVKKDNFGWILGTGLGKDFGGDSNYLTFSAGFRYKKFYFDIELGTNQTIEGGLKIEF